MKLSIKYFHRTSRLDQTLCISFSSLLSFFIPLTYRNRWSLACLHYSASSFAQFCPSWNAVQQKHARGLFFLIYFFSPFIYSFHVLNKVESSVWDWSVERSTAKLWVCSQGITPVEYLQLQPWLGGRGIQPGDRDDTQYWYSIIPSFTSLPLNHYALGARWGDCPTKLPQLRGGHSKVSSGRSLPMLMGCEMAVASRYEPPFKFPSLPQSNKT